MAYAVLGPRGTFSEEAASLYWGEDVELWVARNIAELFAMVESKLVAGALVPLENSLAGSINPTMIALQSAAVRIKGEISMSIKQHLMACRNYQLEDLELLISQPAALMQCEHFIRANLDGVRTEISDSTARAALILQTESRKAASIGNRQAAQLYGLEIIYSDIADNYNITRFVHISPSCQGDGPFDTEPGEKEGEKSSIIFSLSDNAGALYETLGVFARRNLNLSKIESRPSPDKKGFSFYIEVDSGAVEIETVLAELKNYCNHIKYLGSYKKCDKLLMAT